jgi:superfamily II DNA or RNA helicase
MSDSTLETGKKVQHAEFGEGVIVAPERGGYVRVFFPSGERLVPFASLQTSLSWDERVLSGVEGTDQRRREIRLCLEAHALPLMENATALTSAPIDLLPHQVVLTHRIASASPRRFLVADEVGLGKTIETGLLLRELASRDELSRTLMIVPAGLVDNWDRELNQVFKLNFEVFGALGDVTDRKSNAFANHNRLIASIDTLKRPERLKRLLQSPRWDLIVFDEAHHLSASKQGKRVRKTENYKLAEALKEHTRDLLLLSATPHQGDHFSFWMLIQLLNPTLFRDVEDMVSNRHRLNSVMFRRTKADACKPDGSPLFARRSVHTEALNLSDTERVFYQALQAYISDGFDLSKRQGGSRGLGFVMAIFQKIAASSFAAVRRTLTRRLIGLTLHESLLKEQSLDLDGRQRLLAEARDLIHEEYQLPRNPFGQNQVEAILADLRLRVHKKLDEEELERVSGMAGDEVVEARGEDAVALLVQAALPEERDRIRDLLRLFPQDRETKLAKLVEALGILWAQKPDEKIVIFATYLGTVELIGKALETNFPGKGVVVLRGGDHDSKTAAEKKFKRPDGPKVIVCTAAGREGINLQHARILFNFDLPWNPMDVEQRIGRIHRYKQLHTAQVYNIVLGDTIEGRIYLLLEQKLKTIAEAVGKVDSEGNIAEDLRGQILGQLAERLAYDRLYREAVADPGLKRTELEIESAMSNAREARQVVFDLFQDLEGFSLDDYQPYTDVEPAKKRMVAFLSDSVKDEGFLVKPLGSDQYLLEEMNGKASLKFTTDRASMDGGGEQVLMGLDHPVFRHHLDRWQGLKPEFRGVSLKSGDGSGILSWWKVECTGKEGERKIVLLPLAIDDLENRVPRRERIGIELLEAKSSPSMLTTESKLARLKGVLEPMLERELLHRGLINEKVGYSSTLVGWIEDI